MNKNIHVFAFDIDGTIYRSDQTISPLLKSTLLELQDKGFTITLASARPILSILNIAKDIGLTSPMVGANGAVVADQNHNFLFKRSMSREHFTPVFELAKKYSAITLCFYVDFDWYVNKDSEQTQEEIESLNFSPKFITNAIPFDHCEKVSALGPQEELMRFHAEIRNIDPTLNLAFSKPGYLEITTKNISKLEGLKHLSESLNIPLSQFLAAGDGEPDIPMLQECGIGLAMGNSPTHVKKFADFVLDSHETDSLAEYLQENFLP